MIDLQYGQITQVNSFNDINNFDELFDVSFPAMETNTFKWPAELNTQEQKRDYYKNIIEINLLNHKSFSFKRVVDGRDVSLNVGYRVENYWIYLHALVNNINGSRGWIFNEHVTPQQTQYLLDNGFAGVVLQSFGDVATVKHQLKKYSDTSKYNISDTYFDENTNILKTKIDFISSSFHNAETLSDTRLS